MSGRSQKNIVKKPTKNTRGSYSILINELHDAAATPTGTDDQADPTNNLGSLPSSGVELADYLKAATSNFEKVMDEAVQSLIESVRKVERALEFEGQRINELEKKNAELELRMGRMEKSFTDLAQRIGSHDSDVNKAERSSRRNNFRVIGIQESMDVGLEDCAQIVEDIIKTKFKLEVKVERALREGRKGDNPRHIIVKTSSYDEKVAIMKSAREALKEDPFYFVNDLTKRDLEQKRKHKKEVQDLYSKGTKLRFYAGQWRGNGGVPYFTA